MNAARMNYRPDIDGLRAVAVLAVVLNHLSAPLLPGGYVGVDVFFVISGYLITGIISREMAQGQFTFARFSERRARRIFPALFAMLAVTLLASYLLLLPSDMKSTLKGTLGTLFFASNLVFWREMAAGYFAATDLGLNPLLHTWSLAVEEQFYLLFPVLLLLCYRNARQRIVPVLLLCALLSLSAAALLVKSKSVAVFFLSPFRAWELLVGALLTFNALPLLGSRMAREMAAGMGLLAILWACFIYDRGTTFPGLAALPPVLGTAAVIHAGASGSSLATKLLQTRTMVFVGLISYSLYLWHWPLIVLVRYAAGMAPITPYLPALFLASMLLAWLSYRFIEQPFRHKALVSQRLVLVSTAALTATMTLTACTGLWKEGFEARFSPEVVRMDKTRIAEIPFVQCDGQSPQSWCTLGQVGAAPATLLWGDSHLLAWAPAIDQILLQQGSSAVFAEFSACPPMLNIRNHRPGCPEHNLAVRDYLLKHPEIRTVLMAANWSKYFDPAYPLGLSQGKTRLQGVEAAQQGLTESLDWLRGSGRSVLLVGSVPVYETDVLLSLALAIASNRNHPLSDAEAQVQKNLQFYETVRNAGTDTRLKLLDPIQWICKPDCRLVLDGMPLYRDGNHLSVAGALAFKNNLDAAFISEQAANDQHHQIKIAED